MSKPLIVFYSLKGETYLPEGIEILEKGHTAQAAEFIAEAVEGDLFEIETIKEYKTNHYKMIKEAKEELDKGIKPELKKYPDSLEDYEIIYLGYPNWFNTLPNPVMTFLENTDLSGKKIVPFSTSGGGGIEKSLPAIEERAPQAEILEGKNFLGHKVDQSEEEIKSWAKGVLEE